MNMARRSTIGENPGHLIPDSTSNCDEETGVGKKSPATEPQRPHLAKAEREPESA